MTQDMNSRFNVCPPNDASMSWSFSTSLTPLASTPRSSSETLIAPPVRRQLAFGTRDLLRRIAPGPLNHLATHEPVFGLAVGGSNPQVLDRPAARRWLSPLGAAHQVLYRNSRPVKAPARRYERQWRQRHSYMRTLERVDIFRH